MNIRMVRESEERQKKFLENLFKQQQEADKLEREKEREFLLKLGQMFKNDNLFYLRKHVVFHILCNLHFHVNEKTLFCLIF